MFLSRENPIWEATTFRVWTNPFVLLFGGVAIFVFLFRAVKFLFPVRHESVRYVPPGEEQERNWYEKWDASE